MFLEIILDPFSTKLLINDKLTYNNLMNRVYRTDEKPNTEIVKDTGSQSEYRS